jgi:hypothetical protein
MPKRVEGYALTFRVFGPMCFSPLQGLSYNRNYSALQNTNGAIIKQRLT